MDLPGNIYIFTSYTYVIGFAKRVLCAQSFKSHFSPPFDRYNNRLTIHAYTIAKGSKVYFYWGFIHRPVWHPRVLRCSLNCSNLPGQADSRQGITTRLAGETGHWRGYIMWYSKPKQPELMPFGHIIFFKLEGPATLWYPTLHFYRSACGIDYLVKWTI